VFLECDALAEFVTTWRKIVRGETRGVHGAALRAALWLLQWPYRAAVWLRNSTIKPPFRAAVPVLCVGNLSVGGTGKTACVEFIAKKLRTQGAQVVILSRGYAAGSQSRNDEAMVLEANLPDVPQLQSPDRVALAMLAVEELEAEMLLLDDGFQHRRLHRDVDIVLIDASEPLSACWPLPRGTWREPLSALRRATAVILTRVDQATSEQLAFWRQTLAQRVPDVPVAEAVHAPTHVLQLHAPELSCDVLRGLDVVAFCGLGHPEAFFATLRSLGALIVECKVFSDHHNYTRNDVDELIQFAGARNCAFVTTQKDWVKLQVAELDGKPLYALKVDFVITAGEEHLDAVLTSLIPDSISGEAA